jgi:hypothetical protein
MQEAAFNRIASNKQAAPSDARVLGRSHLKEVDVLLHSGPEELNCLIDEDRGLVVSGHCTGHIDQPLADANDGLRPNDGDVQ